MYDSLRTIADGFGKNARALHGEALWRLGFGLPLVALLPWFILALATVSPATVDDVAAACGLVVTIAAAAKNRRLMGSSPWWALATPLVMIVVGAVFVRAAVLRRGHWRGRTFST
jgi:hypothetical protein